MFNYYLSIEMGGGGKKKARVRKSGNKRRGMQCNAISDSLG